MDENVVFTVEEQGFLHKLWLEQHGQDYVISESDEKEYGKYYNKSSKYFSLTEQGYLYLKNPNLAKGLAKKYGSPIPMEY